MSGPRSNHSDYGNPGPEQRAQHALLQWVRVSFASPDRCVLFAVPILLINLGCMGLTEWCKVLKGKGELACEQEGNVEETRSTGNQC